MLHGLNVHVVNFQLSCITSSNVVIVYNQLFTVLPAKSDSDDMFCLQSYQGLVIDKSLVY